MSVPSAPAAVDTRDAAGPICVVTGGSGFVGRHIIRALLRYPHIRWRVVVFDLRPYVHEKPSFHSSTSADGNGSNVQTTSNVDEDYDNDKDRVSSIVGDITRLGDVGAALATASLVIHAATADPLDNKNLTLMWRVNVDGTKNVVEACKQCAVGRLIYISSASVVFDGTSMLSVDETRPFPDKYIDFYSMTKAEAEKFVLAANKPSLATCALRPSSVFGEGDLAFLPRVAEVGRSGKSRFAIGDGSALWDFTYAGNLARACITAASKLNYDSPIAGQAYFITNAEPRRCWDVIGTIQSRLGYNPPSIFIPFWICYFLATLVDWILILIKPLYVPKKLPNFTRERVRLLTCHRTFSCEKAKRDFGYIPHVSMDEALDRTIASYPNLASPKIRSHLIKDSSSSTATTVSDEISGKGGETGR